MSKKHKDEAKNPLENNIENMQATEQAEAKLDQSQAEAKSDQSQAAAEENQPAVDQKDMPVADATATEDLPSKGQDSGAGTEENAKLESDKALTDALALVKDLEDKNLRLAAEFDNFRKRSRKEKEESYSQAKLDLVRDFLPLLDALDRAQDSYNKLEGEAFTQLKEGMDLLVRQGQDCLTKLGVEEIPAEGAQFDPNLHDAVQHVEDEQYGENVIIDCLLKGYQADDKVIRHSMVRVAN